MFLNTYFTASNSSNESLSTFYQYDKNFISDNDSLKVSKALKYTFRKLMQVFYL